ncbi:MAG: hypothetical protein DRP84_01635 [Spirochaetes bacterium]|nr:MAG: hypothetical protein DRP84_01635 [Spirochaetota bacterium]
MKEIERKQTFIFPGNTGDISLNIYNGSFPEITNDDLYRLGKIVRDFLYGLMIEDSDNRNNFINIFTTILKDSSLAIEDKNLDNLLKYSARLFQEGDYENSLFISKYILARINSIIDEKIAHNSKRIDKEIIKIQISTLNFISYLFTKLHRNIDYGLKLSKIAGKLLDGFNSNSQEIKSMRAAILDTIGALYIEKEDWNKAVENLARAHDYDKELLSIGQVDEVGFRITCSNLGYAMVNYCASLLDKENEKININEIESKLHNAEVLFNMVKVDQAPPVPENRIKDLELLSAIKRTKEGAEIIKNLRIKIQRRFI